MRRLLFILLLLIPRLAEAQSLLPDFMQQYSDSLGVPVASGFVCTTISGTTTNLASYPTAADAIAMTNPNANPIVLDSAGRGSIWLGSGTYRIVLSNRIGVGSGTCNGHPTGSAIKTVDGIATPSGGSGTLPSIPAHTYLGNNTGGSAVATAITVAQLTADLNVFTTTLQGLVPASGGGTVNFLRADGTWAVPAGSGGGTVTTTGSPANGNLAKFSGATSIVNGDVSGDCTTSGTLAISCTKTAGVAFATSATTDMTNLSNATSGTVASARGGAGTVNGALKGSAGVVSQAACGDLSNAAASCSIDATNGSNLSSGAIGIRVNPRTNTTASSASITINSDTTDVYTITALAAGATFNPPSGTPVNGQRLLIRIKDNGTPRALSFSTASGGFRASTDLAFPTTTTTSKTQYNLFVFNSTDTKWDFLAFLDNL